MKIAIASKGDPRSVKTWSGIPYFIIKALEKGSHSIFAINLKSPTQPWYYDWFRRFYYRLQKKWFLAEVEPFILQRIGEQFDREVSAINPDLVLCIHGDFLSYSTFKQPAIIIHDTTFASLLNYYPEFSNLTRRSILAGNSMYQRALNKSAAAVFSALWASQSALTDYKVDSKKVHTIPLGANLDFVPMFDSVSQWIEERAQADTCNFLFLGVNWARKGGPDSLRVVKALQQAGVFCKLIVIGCTAVVEKEDEHYIEQIGFLRKDVPAEYSQLNLWLQKCHALLLPSVAECYGCVYCEANAYGLPALGRDTGGIPEIIKEDVNGLLLGKTETPEAFSKRWLAIWSDRKRYIMMSQNARNQYEQRLNYSVFVEKLLSIKIVKAQYD